MLQLQDKFTHAEISSKGVGVCRPLPFRVAIMVLGFLSNIQCTHTFILFQTLSSMQQKRPFTLPMYTKLVTWFLSPTDGMGDRSSKNKNKKVLIIIDFGTEEPLPSTRGPYITNAPPPLLSGEYLNRGISFLRVVLGSRLPPLQVQLVLLTEPPLLVAGGVGPLVADVLVGGPLLHLLLEAGPRVLHGVEGVVRVRPGLGRRGADRAGRLVLGAGPGGAGPDGGAGAGPAGEGGGRVLGRPHHLVQGREPARAADRGDVPEGGLDVLEQGRRREVELHAGAHLPGDEETDGAEDPWDDLHDLGLLGGHEGDRALSGDDHG